ncbi:MAG: FAD-dependent oxidoreductase [Candidatus Omnitrophota bacterium]
MKQFVIIGNSAAGIAAAEQIRKYDRESKITMISDEDYPAYCRCLISYYLAAEVKEEKIVYRPESFYKENNIELFLKKKVARIDLKKNRVILEDKTQLGFDALLVATGSSPKFPQTTGIKKTGVLGFRTIKNAKDIEGLLPVTKSACILGGGLVGLKAAYALKKRNLEVKVIVKSKQVLSQMLDFDAASFVQKKLEENGIEIILGQDAQEIIGNGGIRAVKLDSGKVLGCSLVIVGKGVAPNIDLVKESEIKFNEGILADKFLLTNIPSVYTAGDVCESFDVTLGEYAVNALWPMAVEQGKIAGQNMAGQNIAYEGSLGINSIEFFGLPAISLGIYKKKEGEGGFEEFKMTDKKKNLYKKVLLKDNIILGVILVGDIRKSGIFLRLMRERIDTRTVKDKLLSESFGYPDIMDLVKEKERERIYV